MRLAVLLLSLSVLPITASADALYHVTFTFPFRGFSGSGTIRTDGTCISCQLGAGLLEFSFTLADVPFFGPATFDNPAFPASLSLDTSSLELAGAVYDSAGDSLGFFFQPGSPPFPYAELGVDGSVLDALYRVGPGTVPETTSVILLASALAMLGFLSRRTHV